MRKRKALLALCVAIVATGLLQARQAPLTPQDYVEIQQLYARYSYGLDSVAADGAMFADLFTQDGILLDETGKATQGRENLAALARAYPGKTPTNVQHLIWNVRIEPAAGGGASGKSYVAITKLGPPGQPAMLVDSGQYWDDLVKTANGWRIRKREFKKAAVGSAGRGTQAPAQPAPAGRGRGQ